MAKMVKFEKPITYKLQELRKKFYPGHGGQKVCAEKMGVNYTQWKHWESGWTYPNSKSIKMLAEFFGVSESYLTDETEPENKQQEKQIEELTKELEQIKNENIALSTENKKLKEKLLKAEAVIEHYTNLMMSKMKNQEPISA